MSRNASKIISDDVNVESRIKSSQQLWAIDQLLRTDINFSSPDIKLIKRLHSQLRNVYSFNVLAGQAVLGRVNQMIGDALSKQLLGDLESRLGNVDQARGHYDHAIELYQKEQAKLGLANALQSFGDLLFSTNRVEKAKQYYQKALLLYHSEQEPMGLAYTSAELIRCNHRLGSLNQDELKELAAEALIMAERSGVESVSQYVLTALYEAFDEDEGRLKDLLKKIGVKV